MEKEFTRSAVEAKWGARGEELGVGHADVASEKPTFVIALPPPNITAELHLGHAASSSVQDTLCRYHRMRGFGVAWFPGSAHAAIATQNVIERRLAAAWTTEKAIGRDAFV